MPKRTIKAVYFRYRTDKGTYVTARRGETVEVPEGRYLDRGDRLDAFVTTQAEELAVANQAAGVVAPTEPVTPQTEVVEVVEVTDDELTKALEGNVDEVLAYAAGNPDQVQALLDIEKAQEKPRKGVVEGLTKLIEG